MRAEQVAHALRERGWQTDLFVGQSRQASVDWGLQVATQADRLVVVGGDGTLNAVVEGLVQSKAAALPPTIQLGLGTANLLMRELKLPKRSGPLSAAVDAGYTRCFDLGQLQLQSHSPGIGPIRPSLLVWDFGLGGALMKAMDEVRTGPIRKASYFKLLPRLLRDWQPAPQRVIADGQDLGEFEYGIVSGIRTYASSAFRLPSCAYDDGLWELYLLPRVSTASLIGLGQRALTRRLLKTPGLVYRQAKQVSVQGEKPTPVQIDGDYYGTTPVEFELTGRQLPVLAPRPPSA